VFDEILHGFFYEIVTKEFDYYRMGRATATIECLDHTMDYLKADLFYDQEKRDRKDEEFNKRKWIERHGFDLLVPPEEKEVKDEVFILYKKMLYLILTVHIVVLFVFCIIYINKTNFI
jgi:hypothetical protein